MTSVFPIDKNLTFPKPGIVPATGLPVSSYPDHGYAADSVSKIDGLPAYVPFPAPTTPVQELFRFAALGDVARVQALLKKHPEIVNEAARVDGRRALHYAANNGHLLVCQALVRAGADANLARTDGRLPLHQAAETGLLDVVRFLVEDAGTQPDAKDMWGGTPFQNALRDEVRRYLKTQTAAYHAAAKKKKAATVAATAAATKVVVTDAAAPVVEAAAAAADKTTEKAAAKSKRTKKSKKSSRAKA